MGQTSVLCSVDLSHLTSRSNRGFSYLNENVEILDLQNENVWQKKKKENENENDFQYMQHYLSFNFTLTFSSSLTVFDLTFHERRLPFMTFHDSWATPNLFGTMGAKSPTKARQERTN